MFETYFLTISIMLGFLIAADVMFYRWRRGQHDQIDAALQKALVQVNRVRLWLKSRSTAREKPAAQISAPAPQPESLLAPAPAVQDLQPEQASPAQQAPAIVAESAVEAQIPVSPTHEAKVVHVQFSADIPEGTVVHITMEVVDSQGRLTSHSASLSQGATISQPAVKPVRESQAKAAPAEKRANWFGGLTSKSADTLKKMTEWLRTQIFSQMRLPSLQSLQWDRVFLILVILIYALAVSLDIDKFPVYFFTDEAAHMNLAADFIRDGYQNYYGEFMPTYFVTEGWVNGTSVYVQVIPYLIFGKSVIVTRLVSAFITLLGAIAVSLLLRDIFKLKTYWAGVLLVLTTPAWFLHARTAFEYVEVGSFYAFFLYFYNRYRAGHLRSLYWAIIAGALTFYTHGLGQILMGVSGLALFVVDFQYHIHPDRRKTVLNGLMLGGLLLLPFARYYISHPNESAEQVKRRGSYWVNNNLNLLQKVGEFLWQYMNGLSPIYWYGHSVFSLEVVNKFIPVNTDMNRHVMSGYGNGLLATLPLALAGLVKSFRNIRKPEYRSVLIALLACPVPASVVAIGMPRMVWMTIPMALLGVIGLASIMEWAEARWKLLAGRTTALVFLALAALSFYMLRDALVNGPTWFQDYSLYGMQYGASQIFDDVVRKGLEEDPSRYYIVSPSWANGTEQFISFFIPLEVRARIGMGQPVDVIDSIRKSSANIYFVTTVDEYEKLIKNPEFTDIQVKQIVPYPNQKPGFYVLTLNVAPNIEQMIAAKKEADRKPVEDTITMGTQSVRIIHSPIGAGRMEDVFDENPDSLARVVIANPFLIDMYPQTPLDTHSVNIQTGSLPNFTVTISLYAPGSSTPVVYTQTFKGLPPDPKITMSFDNGPAKSERITIEIKDNTSVDTSQIHVRTINFK